MTYRNRQLLAFARDNQCQWCGKRDGTIVAAHSNQLRHGKGMGLKADDRRIAFLCHSCHADLDQGRWMTREQRQLLWETAHRKTQQLLMEAGLVDPTDDQRSGQTDPERQAEIRSGPDVHAEANGGLRGKGG